MSLLKKIKAFFTTQKQDNLDARLIRLERAYIVLLKRVLEIDGIKLTPSKMAKFSNKVLQTPKDELNKGFNEPKPTLH